MFCKMGGPRLWVESLRYDRVWSCFSMAKESAMIALCLRLTAVGGAWLRHG